MPHRRRNGCRRAVVVLPSCCGPLGSWWFHICLEYSRGSSPVHEIPPGLAWRRQRMEVAVNGVFSGWPVWEVTVDDVQRTMEEAM